MATFIDHVKLNYKENIITSLNYILYSSKIDSIYIFKELNCVVIKYIPKSLFCFNL